VGTELSSRRFSILRSASTSSMHLKMEFHFQSNSVMNSLKCPKSKSLGQAARFMGNPCFSVSRLQKLSHSAVYDPASVYQLSTAAPSAPRVRLYVRVRRLKPIQARRTHTRTHARTHTAHTRARTHITEVSLVGPRLALSPEVGVCVCTVRQKRGTIFRQTPLRGT
jgi:hypothetical protein